MLPKAKVLVPDLAAAVNLPTLSVGIKDATTPAEVSTALQVLLVLTILTVAPAILLMTTAFTRIIIVLSFVRQAMGTQNTPPNQVLLGLALFLTLFVMAPTFNSINQQALQPYMQEKITQQQALSRSLEVMREYAKQNGYELDLTDTRRHHEIYLSDPRKCDAHRLKTVLRQPIRRGEPE